MIFLASGARILRLHAPLQSLLVFIAGLTATSISRAEVGNVVTVVHQAELRQTVVRWQEQKSAPDALYNIYRSDEPIDVSRAAFARLVGSRIKWSETGFTYSVPDGGTHYYAVFRSSVMGKEIREFSKDVSAPVEERGSDVVPAPQLVKKALSGRLLFSWKKVEQAAPIRPAEYEVYSRRSQADSWSLLLKCGVRNLKRHGEMLVLDLPMDRIVMDREYCLKAVDAFGNESEYSNVVYLSRRAELEVSPDPLIARNADIAISKMYPKPGEAVSIGVDIHNLGQDDAKGVPVKVIAWLNGDSPTTIAAYRVDSVPGLDVSSTSFSWTPKSAGR